MDACRWSELWICQVNGVKSLSEGVAKDRRRDNVGMF